MSTINNNQAKVVSAAEATHQVNQIHRTGKLTAPSKQSLIVTASLIFGFVLLGGIFVNLYKSDQPKPAVIPQSENNDLPPPGTFQVVPVPDHIKPRGPRAASTG
jgi:hypothetical protein